MLRIRVNIIVIVLQLLCNSYLTFSQTKEVKHDSCFLRSASIEMLYSAIKDTNMSIGVFESPSIESSPRILKSGLIPELSDRYIELMINYNLIKLNTLTPIRGVFDSIIYINQPFRIAADNFRTVIFFFNTRWLLFLRKTVSNNGVYPQDWLYEFYQKCDKNIFNENTLFIDPYESQNPICIEWKAEEKRPVELEIKSEFFTQELKVVTDVMNIRNKTERLNALLKIINKDIIKDGCLRNIVKRIIDELKLELKET